MTGEWETLQGAERRGGPAPGHLQRLRSATCESSAPKAKRPAASSPLALLLPLLQTHPEGHPPDLEPRLCPCEVPGLGQELARTARRQAARPPPPPSPPSAGASALPDPSRPPTEDPPPLTPPSRAPRREELNPGWAYKLWTDSEADALVRKLFPQYWAAYDALERRIEKTDLFRRALPPRRGPPLLFSAASPQPPAAREVPPRLRRRAGTLCCSTRGACTLTWTPSAGSPSTRSSPQTTPWRAHFRPPFRSPAASHSCQRARRAPGECLADKGWRE